MPLPINCVVPGECLSVTASWCVPGNDGMVNCATNNVDVRLDLPGGGTVGVGAGELLDLAGCIHDGDDQAGPPLDRDGDGQLGPFSENITCSPFVQPVGPPAMAPGVYVVSVRDNFSVLDTGMIVVDVNIDGINQRTTVNVDDSSVAQFNVEYP